MFDLEIPPAGAPPLWLRLLVLAAQLWLATRITENVTSALVGMVHGNPAAPEQPETPHLRWPAAAG